MTGVVLAVLAASLVACHDIYPFETNPPDAASEASSSRDGALDVRSSLVADGLSRSDVPIGDGPGLDSPLADAAAGDSAPSDFVGAEAPAADATAMADASGALACNSANAIPVWMSGNGLVICQDLAYSPTTLCEASKLCNLADGWKLCPASQYNSMISAVQTLPVANAWIASCVRDDGVAQAPSDVPCKCVEKVTPLTPISWECATGQVAQNVVLDNVGLETASSCHRVGLDDPTTEGAWMALGPKHSLTRAVCCM